MPMKKFSPPIDDMACRMLSADVDQGYRLDEEMCFPDKERAIEFGVIKTDFAINSDIRGDEIRDYRHQLLCRVISSCWTESILAELVRDKVKELIEVNRKSGGQQETIAMLLELLDKSKMDRPDYAEERYRAGFNEGVQEVIRLAFRLSGEELRRKSYDILK